VKDPVPKQALKEVGGEESWPGIRWQIKALRKKLLWSNREMEENLGL